MVKAPQRGYALLGLVLGMTGPEMGLEEGFICSKSSCAESWIYRALGYRLSVWKPAQNIITGNILIVSLPCNNSCWTTVIQEVLANGCLNSELLFDLTIFLLMLIRSLCLPELLTSPVLQKGVPLAANKQENPCATKGICYCCFLSSESKD